jgi:hypothetical protein
MLRFSLLCPPRGINDVAYIRMLQSVVGERFSWDPDEVVEVSEADAAVWADGVRAVRVRADGVEMAVAGPPEMAARRTRTRSGSFREPGK